MRQGQQNRRGRGRSTNNSNSNNNNNNSHNNNNGRKPQNPLSRNYESSGPDVKIRGTAAQVAEKYMALARDAGASGDPVLAENYLQHAEHYNRIIMAAQAQIVPTHQPMPQHHNGQGEYGHNGMNGQHRHQPDIQPVMRDQPQPIIEQPQPQPQIAAPQAQLPGMEPQPEIVERPREESPAAAQAEPAADGTRRRRRRYPAGGAGARGAVSAEGANGHGASGNGHDGAGETSPPDEVLAN